MALKIS